MRLAFALLLFCGFNSLCLGGWGQLGGPKGTPVFYTVLSEQADWESIAPMWDKDMQAGIEVLKQKGTPFYFALKTPTSLAYVRLNPAGLNVYKLPAGKMLLTVFVGQRTTAPRIVIDKIEETATTIELYYHEENQTAAQAGLSYPSVSIELPSSDKTLQFRRVPYTLKGGDVNLNYKKAEGVVFTEYLGKQEEVDFGDDK